MKQVLEHRNAALLQASNPLPGSRPYDNDRPINIPARFDGRTLLECVCEMYPQIDAAQWNEWFRFGHILRSHRPAHPHRLVRGGEQFWHRFPETIEPDVDARVRVIWEDETLVGIDKPAPLPVHPCGRFNRNTLTHLIEVVYGKGELRLVHRLDANTSGVMVLARSKEAATDLREQFERNQVRKRYLVRVLGQPSHDHFFCDARISRTRSWAGTRVVDTDGLDAVTEFRVLKRFSDDTSLLEAIPRTGRTNQIRIHLWSIRIPVMGDPAYLADRQIAARQTLTPACPSMCLHAWSLSLRHPGRGEAIRFTADLPIWSTLGSGQSGLDAASSISTSP